MDGFREGQEVFIRAVIDRVPSGKTKLYRLVTEKGTVVWADAEELEAKPQTESLAD